MWEGGVRIYGTPGVPNNFPYFKPFEKIHTKGPYYKTVITTDIFDIF